MPNRPFIYEILYRGNPDGSNAYHVILGVKTTDPFTNAETVSYTDPLTPSQASQFDFDMPALIAQVNVNVVEENDKLKQTIAALEDAAGGPDNEPGWFSNVLSLFGWSRT